MKRAKAILVPGLICGFLLGLYLYTMAPGLTWAYDGADGGDLITAAATGGVPHPTGYPTYLLAASAFLRLPIGSLAYRTNLLSAVCAVLAALVVFLLVLALEDDPFTASVASLAFGTFPLVWSQAIITEVYALNALFAALLLYLAARADSRPLMVLVGGMIAGLAIGNHLSIVLMLPLLLIPRPGPADLAHNAESKPWGYAGFGASTVWRILGLVLGMAVYLIIPLRARSQAPVNWGNAVNIEGFTWLVSGRVYWGRLGDIGLSYLWTGMRAWSHLLLQQLGMIGMILVAISLAVAIKRSWINYACGYMILAYSALAIVFRSPDSYVYLLPAMLGLSVWMALAAGWILRMLGARLHLPRWVAIVLIPGYLVVQSILAIPSMSLSTDRRAEQYAQTVLNSAPAAALVFTGGDEATFSLWYFHYAYHKRPDVAVIASNLLAQPWYRPVLTHTYPNLVIPEHALPADIIHDNPARPSCVLGPNLEPTLDCLP